MIVIDCSKIFRQVGGTQKAVGH